MKHINIDIHKKLFQHRLYYYDNIVLSNKTYIEINITIASLIHDSVHINTRLNTRFKILRN